MAARLWVKVMEKGRDRFTVPYGTRPPPFRQPYAAGAAVNPQLHCHHELVSGKV